MSDREMWIGGANLPTRYMRVNATWPLARLSVDGGKIEICLRPRLLGKAFRADELSASPDAVECLYRAVGKLFWGVGVKTRAGRDYYFRTSAAEEIIAAARTAGFTVANEPKVPTKIWNPVP